MSAHDRFESLAGAVVLGEATPQERAEFDAHAVACAECRDDASAGALVVAWVTEAERGETWRPSQPIVERIRSRRTGRARFTLGALGWAVGASLVANVALAGGLGARLAGAFQSQAPPPAYVSSSAISLDAPHLRILPPQTWHRPRVVVADATPKRRAHRSAHAVAPASTTVAAKKHEPKLPTLDDVPDVLAGIDVYGTGTARHRVAIETLPHCTAHGDDRADVVLPCRDADGRVVR